MKRQDILKHHHMDQSQLQTVISDIELNLVAKRMTLKLGQEKNLHVVKNLRHDLAQIKTILHHKTLTGSPATPKTPTLIKVAKTTKTPKITPSANIEAKKTPKKTTKTTKTVKKVL
jgi:ribosomal protein L29